MAEQLPSTTHIVGGQPTINGWILPDANYGFEEDSEVKTTASGKFAADITYSRRITLSVTLEALLGTNVSTYAAGGQIASGIFAKPSGGATAWKIKSSTLAKSRSVTVVTLDLIALTDEIA